MTASSLNFETFFNIVKGERRVSDKTTFSVDPSTEARLWDVPVATTRDVEDAVESANDAFKAWSTTPFEQRVSKISQWKQLYEQYAEDFTNLLMAECGKPRSIAAGEANEIIALFDHNLQLRLPEERIEDDTRIAITRHVPVGVVAAICPWNFPLVLSVGKILPALLTGCSIIVKPSPFTPYSALKMVELAQKIFPPGVVQAIGGDDSIGPALVNHRCVNKISFTGSSATGKRIMASAAATLKRVTLELYVYPLIYMRCSTSEQDIQSHAAQSLGAVTTRRSSIPTWTLTKPLPKWCKGVLYSPVKCVSPQRESTCTSLFTSHS